MSGVGGWPATLTEALAERAGEGERGLLFVGAEGTVPVSFASLHAQARRVGGALRAAGAEAGDAVLVAAPEEATFARIFLGAVAAGLLPAGVAPPRGLHDVENAVARIAGLAETAGARWLVLGAPLEAMAPQLRQAAPRLRILAAKELEGGEALARLWPARPEDACYLQFTSGTTRAPRAVVVRHENLAANTAAIMRDGLDVDGERDLVASWVPLFHDMGLVGFLLAPLFVSVDSAILSAAAFAAQPTLWLETLSRLRATVTFGPAFAYELAVRRLEEEALGRLDLSRLRVAGCGAEPVRCDRLRDIARRLEPTGFRPEVFMPAYGLAEATLAGAFAGVGRGPRGFHADRGALARGILRPSQGPDGIELASCGPPFPRHEIRIVGRESGALLPEGCVGEIELRGPSLTRGYRDEPGQAASEWFRPGDLGCVHGGELYVLGRASEVVWVGEGMHLPHHVERLVEAVPGVRPGGSVAFSSHPAPHRESRLQVAAERARDAEPELLRAQIRAVLRAALGIVPERVWILEPRSLPKTTSGKLRRGHARVALQGGRLPEVDERAGSGGQAPPPPVPRLGGVP